MKKMRLDRLQHDFILFSCNLAPHFCHRKITQSALLGMTEAEGQGCMFSTNSLTLVICFVYVVIVLVSSNFAVLGGVLCGAVQFIG